MSVPDNRPVIAYDFLGNLIVSGCTICYPVRRGSRMWLKKMTVLSVQDTPRGTSISGTNGTGRRISIYKLDNCVVVGS